jgi:hypothetical protein
MPLTMRPLMIVAALAAGGGAVPGVAEADGWRGRGHGHGWGGPPPRVYHHHHHYNRGWRGNDAALGAIIGLGAGVVIGSVLAPPPPPPRVYYYAPPPPPVVYAPAPGHWVQPPPVWVPARPGW